MTAPTLKGYWTVREAIDHAAPADAAALRAALESGELRAAAICERDGALVAVPAATWRRCFARRDDPRRVVAYDKWFHRPIHGAAAANRVAFDEARTGLPIPVATTSDGRPATWACPIIAQADLARWAGAAPQPEPVERPPGWEQPPERPALASDDLLRRTWMEGYLTGYKEAKDAVAKRDVAIAACVHATGCTTRQAEAAYEAAPYPALRNPPPTERGKQPKPR